ncbi:hypothetical protein Tc00.1047053503875.40 [Trypanosoma cruzi]|uniref:Uncharacterized protein n=1 Tax=Trypanosoma cruzi (strain CL Brener) TaxID=353153 RepID=Q4CSJ8_TRYCC|nr:hypothetical protein Tc00.1047053503875.40 [Trypanosoma cruzi]EAN83252.1 hypothetical protein Tc00.1047053503875.40 [Trypanosoma cruzi]|eukprot:XP_805103.1 hypothetical protein [Trypanosoma cruzi strain CL Brener]
MEQAESAAEAAHKAHTSPHQETACFEPNLLEKEKQNQPLRRDFATLLEARVEKLGASYSPSWRYLRGVAAPHPQIQKARPSPQPRSTSPCRHASLCQRSRSTPGWQQSTRWHNTSQTSSQPEAPAALQTVG